MYAMTSSHTNMQFSLPFHYGHDVDPQTPSSSTVAVPLPTEQVVDIRHPTYRFDLGFLSIPERLRYANPDKLFYFSTLLSLSFGICSTLGELNLRHVVLVHSWRDSFRQSLLLPTNIA